MRVNKYIFQNYAIYVLASPLLIKFWYGYKIMNNPTTENTLSIAIQNNLKIPLAQYYKGVSVSSLKDKEAVTHIK